MIMNEKKVLTKICQQCNRQFEKVKTDSYDYFLNRRMFCDVDCSNKARKGISVSAASQFKKGQNTKEANHSWNGGRHQTRGGYMVVLVGVKKYQLEHRYIMENHLGRKLKKREHVHHLNHDRTDNRIENLKVIDIREHGRLHANERWQKSGAF